MKQIRKRLTYANVMSSIAVFFVLGGGAAIAANQLGKNAVGPKQLKKNAVTTPKLKKNAVSTAKLKKNAVATAKIRNNAVTGAKINEATLGAVPSAATAGTAGSLAGHTPFYIRLGFGQTQLIASHGAVSLTALCTQAGGDDIVQILMQTTQNGAVANAYEKDFDGSAPTEFLNVDTPATDRIFLEEETTSGETLVSYEYDQGWVLGPDNKMLTVNSEGVAMGLNFAGPGCVLGGIVDALG